MHTPTATDLRLLMTYCGSTQPQLGLTSKTGAKLLACRSSPICVTLSLPATGWGPNSGFCFVKACTCFRPRARSMFAPWAFCTAQFLSASHTFCMLSKTLLHIGKTASTQQAQQEPHSTSRVSQRNTTAQTIALQPEPANGNPKTLSSLT